jgi:hypothetical protein
VRHVGRAFRYLNTMFPPATLVPMGAAKFLSIYFALQALAGMGPLRLGAPATLGAATTVLWMLLVRLQDDITDAPADVRLGRAGDPRYRSRPIVTGEITLSELRSLRLVAVGLLVALNVAFGGTVTILAFAGGTAITWLGFQWFFIPALARNPTPLAYLARKALTVLFGLYATAVFIDAFRPAGLTLWVVPLVLAPCAEVAAWEAARKIRVPDDETEYGTYSKVLGWRAAALLPVIFVSLALVCLLPVVQAAGVRWMFSVALTGAGALAVGACLRFRLAPTRQRANLRPYMELFGAVAHGGLVLALAIGRGVMLS